MTSFPKARSTALKVVDCVIVAQTFLSAVPQAFSLLSVLPGNRATV